MTKNTSKIKTEWDLELLYKDKDQIPKDIETIKKAFTDFESNWKNRNDYLENEQILQEALHDIEALSLITDGCKPLMYYNYRQALNSQDKEAEAALNKLSNELMPYFNKCLFFSIKLGKISKDQQEHFLKANNLSKYKYFLKVLFNNAQYDLSEAEEKIMNLKSITSRELWINGSDKILNKQTINFKGKKLPISEASNKVRELPTKDRYALHNLYVQKLVELSDVAENEINAIVTDKKVNDELRGFKMPYSATILGYQNEEREILNLVETVTKNFSISHRFYKLKSKLLKLKKLKYADRSVSVGKTTKSISFNDSYKILQKAFDKADPQFAEILKHFAENGQIDVKPKKGKTGGAFCSSSTGNPTFVLLNHTPSINSAMTFGHEMGHAIHAELSKSQPILYQGHTISVAEVASTLFENFVFDEIFETLSEKEKIVAMHDRLNDDIATIFRQIACFNFELELHTKIREKGALPKEEIASLMNIHMKKYLGPSVDLTKEDGYFFVWWSHIRNFFYVYSYAYGQLISKSLYAEYKKDPKFIEKIKQFLSAGGSKSPEQIFKEVGIDTTNPNFFESGLKQIEEDIKKLEKLTAK
ncbi:MAG: M3 family oligoendopeptidase [Candidatus Paceibacterota bacterium]